MGADHIGGMTLGVRPARGAKSSRGWRAGMSKGDRGVGQSDEVGGSPLVRLWLVLGVALTVGTGWAGAQPLAAKERLEVFGGVGTLGNSDRFRTVPVVPWMHIGATLWIAEGWGVAARHARTGDVAFSGVFAYAGHRYRESGTRQYEYWTTTARYRVALDSGLELSLGVGAQLSGGAERNLARRELESPIESLSEAERAALLPVGDIGETARGSWGQGVAIEMLFGRRVSDRARVAGGIVFQGDWGKGVGYEVVLLTEFRILKR